MMATGRQETILVVDDELVNLEHLAMLLKTEYRIVPAKNGEQALERANALNPDLIILDVMMPGLDGYEVCRRLKASETTHDVPIIFVTSLSAPENEERGLVLGAMDYIFKPFHPAIVRARVTNILTMTRQRKLLEEMANLDGLTEIPNRRNYESTLHKEWYRCMRDQAPLSLAMIDIDQFKQYNDNYGHASGDKVLKSVAQVVQRHLRRPSDMVARYGGEEFVLILPATPAEGARELCRQIVRSVQQMNLEHAYSSVSSVVTISIGGVTDVPQSCVAPGDMAHAADLKLYEAKAKGRNQVRWRDLRMDRGGGTEVAHPAGQVVDAR